MKVREPIPFRLALVSFHSSMVARGVSVCVISKTLVLREAGRRLSNGHDTPVLGVGSPGTHPEQARYTVHIHSCKSRTLHGQPWINPAIRSNHMPKSVWSSSHAVSIHASGQTGQTDRERERRPQGPAPRRDRTGRCTHR